MLPCCLQCRLNKHVGPAHFQQHWCNWQPAWWSNRASYKHPRKPHGVFIERAHCFGVFFRSMLTNKLFDQKNRCNVSQTLHLFHKLSSIFYQLTDLKSTNSFDMCPRPLQTTTKWSLSQRSLCKNVSLDVPIDCSHRLQGSSCSQCSVCWAVGLR